MVERRRIAVATFGRSDFSILRPLCRLLDDAPDFEVGLWVGGAHFDATSGRTIDDVEASGLPVWASIDAGEYTRTPLGTVRMMAAQLAGFGAAGAGVADPAVGVSNSGPTPDLVLILGDRFEAVVAGLAMVPLGIPVGHVSGGSVTEGAIDDVFRHCLTKVAAMHFCDLARFARRIHFMGEDPARIVTTGALGLDAFQTGATRDFGEFIDRFGLDGLRPGYVLVTLHPETQRPELTRPMAEATLGALADFGAQVVVTHPNADPMSGDIIDVIEQASVDRDVFCVTGFGADWYPTAMKNASMMVGNSSGGIIEAASFALPVVDIGDRQKGRDHGPNVLHCGRDRSAILDCLHQASTPAMLELAAAGNVYGDGRGAQRVVAALRDVDWSELARPKRFVDPDPGFVGELKEIP